MSGLMICFFVVAAISLPLSAKTVVYDDVKNLHTVQSIINDDLHKKPGNVLIVFDIDDTLIESNSFVGGDTWYNWQRGRELERLNGGQVTIAKKDKFSCLFAKLGVLYEIGGYHATENNAALIVSQLQEKFDLLALTSRSPDYRSATERELEKAGFNFAGSHWLPQPYALAYDFFDGKNTRPVSYQNGILMSTGLNKGAVLEDILNRLNKKYTSIFFIDDSLQNISNMEHVWKDKKTRVKLFHYTGVDKRISDHDILQSRRSNAEFNSFMKVAFPERYALFNAGKCI